MFIIVFKSCFSKVADLYRSRLSSRGLEYPLSGIPHVVKNNRKRIGSHHGNNEDHLNKYHNPFGRFHMSAHRLTPENRFAPDSVYIYLLCIQIPP